MSWVPIEDPRNLRVSRKSLSCALSSQVDLPAHGGPKTSVNVCTALWAHHCQAVPHVHVGYQAGAPEHPGECGMPGEHPACEATDPKERKDHSRAVEEAADHTEALGFRRLMFHFKGTHSAVVFASDPSALTA